MSTQHDVAVLRADVPEVEVVAHAYWTHHLRAAWRMRTSGTTGASTPTSPRSSSPKRGPAQPLLERTVLKTLLKAL